ncbi:hypothetical protein F5Y07DRAFT_399442 [Xylaria sp. FL0933]|nr:hypothetical protein F5Y07DRAFT_399442 [Xylaria sp. FL0933]
MEEVDMGFDSWSNDGDVSRDGELARIEVRVAGSSARAAVRTSQERSHQSRDLMERVVSCAHAMLIQVGPRASDGSSALFVLYGALLVRINTLKANESRLSCLWQRPAPLAVHTRPLARLVVRAQVLVAYREVDQSQRRHAGVDGSQGSPVTDPLPRGVLSQGPRPNDLKAGDRPGGRLETILDSPFLGLMTVDAAKALPLSRPGVARLLL